MSTHPWDLANPPSETERLRARIRILEERLSEARDEVDAANASIREYREGLRGIDHALTEAGVSVGKPPRTHAERIGVLGRMLVEAEAEADVERAAIVAWLRAYCTELWWERPAAAVRRAADAIERGEHREAP